MSFCRSLALCVPAALCAVSSSAQIANVYIPDGTNTYAYNVSSTGKLNPIKGSPFPTSGAEVGDNGSYYITIDQSSVLHSYPIANNGTIGAEVSNINTLNYTGAACGSPTGGGIVQATASMDITGSNVYVPLFLVNNPACNALQTYNVSKKGVLAFNGATLYAESANRAGDNLAPVLTGNDNFAFSFLAPPGADCFGKIKAFSRDNSGTLTHIKITETDPPLPSGYKNTLKNFRIAGDLNNHLVLVLQATNGCDQTPTPPQLASYTVNQGDISTTNTYDNMPFVFGAQTDASATSAVTAKVVIPSGGANPSMVIDPTGNFLAYGGGVEIYLFHFNGAKPLTALTSIFTGPSTDIYQISWDTYGHLYALDHTMGQMHVYLVTSSGVKETAGSPSAISAGLGAFAIHSN